MTALRPRIIASVIRKDFQSLWPLVLASLLLPLYAVTEEVIEYSTEVQTLVVGIGALATMMLTLTVIHQDAVTGDRNDWLTRPIGLANLCTAKLAFILLTVATPLFIATVTTEITAGRGWVEALLYSLSFLTVSLYVLIPVFVLGLVTGSLIQAGVIGLGLVILQVLFSVLLPRVGADPGSRWIVDLGASAAGLSLCFVALIILVRTKRSDIARLVWVGGSVVVMALITFVPPGMTIALQQALFPGSKATGSLVTSIVEPCLDPTKVVDRNPLVQGLLKARVTADNLPQGWVIKIDNSSVSYRTKGGQTVKGPDSYADKFDGERVRNLAPGYWLGPTNDPRVTNLAPSMTDVETIHWNYDVSLLKPGVSRDLPIDGRRRYLPGVGFCDATRRPQGVGVSCFKPFAQPATVRVMAKGAVAEGCHGCGSVSYKPAILEGFGKERVLYVSDHVQQAQAVTLTTYESRGHVARRSTTAGVPPLCPKPPADAES